jgi:hypothetical protein
MNKKWAKSGTRLRFHSDSPPSSDHFLTHQRRSWIKRSRFSASARAAAIAALTAAVAIPASSRGAQAGEIAVTCTNLFSGANWQIAIDYDRKTVDSNPASISDTEISWRDAKDGWNYRLDRKSGKLTVILASATGGNFLYDRCRLAN